MAMKKHVCLHKLLGWKNEETAAARGREIIIINNSLCVCVFIQRLKSGRRGKVGQRCGKRRKIVSVVLISEALLIFTCLANQHTSEPRSRHNDDDGDVDCYNDGSQHGKRCTFFSFSPSITFSLICLSLALSSALFFFYLKQKEKRKKKAFLMSTHFFLQFSIHFPSLC